MDRHERGRVEMIKRIAVEFCDGFGSLEPIGVHGSLNIWPWSIRSYLDYAHYSMCDIAWQVVLQRIAGMERNNRIIDHAWLFGQGKDCPWGFVTEPYMEESKALEHVATAKAMMPIDEWGVQFHVLPARDSAWNPGQCVPIIAVVEGAWEAKKHIRSAVSWAMWGDMAPTDWRKVELQGATGHG